MSKEFNCFITPTVKKLNSGPKHRSSSISESAISLNSPIGNNCATATTIKDNLNDINLLLYMEMRVRAAEDELNIKRQVQLEYKKYCENFLQYVELYSKYVNLIKMSALREVLQRNEKNVEVAQQQFALDEAKKNLEIIRMKLSCNQISGYIDTKLLKEFHKLIGVIEPYKNIEERRPLMEELKMKYEQIQSSMKSINEALNKNTLRSLDYFIKCSDGNEKNMV